MTKVSVQWTYYLELYEESVTQISFESLQLTRSIPVLQIFLIVHICVMFYNIISMAHDNNHRIGWLNFAFHVPDIKNRLINSRILVWEMKLRTSWTCKLGAQKNRLQIGEKYLLKRIFISLVKKLEKWSDGNDRIHIKSRSIRRSIISVTFHAFFLPDDPRVKASSESKVGSRGKFQPAAVVIFHVLSIINRTPIESLTMAAKH